MPDHAALEQIFEPGGALSSHLGDYEFRSSQLEMARAVLTAISDRSHLCVEAGTGTGKTLSYLIPALLSEKRVLISTATKNLQDQIYFHDLPFLEKVLFPGLKSTYMKGRRNFLCLRRFRDQSRQLVMLDSGREAVSDRLSKWLEETQTGDRAELVWLADDEPMWYSIDARSEICTGQKCEFFEDCFVTRMRQRAFESDVIIVNHALFFANLALQHDEIGRILPDFGVLILDEAHEIEDVAADHFGQRLSNFQLEDLVRQLRRLTGPGSKLTELADRLERDAASFFARFPGGEGRYSLNYFRDERSRQMLDLRYELAHSCDRLKDRLQTLAGHLTAQYDQEEEAEVACRRIDRYLATLQELFDLDNPSHVYWFERSGRGIYLHLTPIEVDSLLRELLFKKVDTTILTSATLTTEGNFDYIKGRLGIPEPELLRVPGEFDFAEQAVLYVPRHIPEPRSREYFLHLLREVRALLRLTEGHAFLLFTSIQQMRKVFGALEGSEEYRVFCQGERPKAQLLEQFKETPRAVLCATASFWQGVDVRGDALRAVIVDKLPFHVPTEPLVSARLQRLQQEGQNPFLDYSVPSAIISLRQGLGRLIRSKKDRGILAVLDSRLWSKRYGELFLESLPNCPVADNIEDLKNFYSKIVS